MPVCLSAIDTSWPKISVENKPGVRWWWLGNAVDQKNLTWNLEELSKVGIGSVEITPIYGVKDNDANEIEYLSPKWMSMLEYTEKEAKRLNMLVDMNGGTGWPFGGPNIDMEHATTMQFIQRYRVIAAIRNSAKNRTLNIVPKDSAQVKTSKLSALLFVGDDGVRTQIPLSAWKDGVLTYDANQNGEIFALFIGKTNQQVKRAAPGGEGLVMDHFSKDAVKMYLKRFDMAFTQSNVSWPHSIFNDSYEIYGADWSGNFLKEFKERRGYDLANYLPEFLGEGDSAVCARVVCDYRETISEMLLFNFTVPWTNWANSHGATTRNQAHGSPGNLLDLYAATDIPECESFGFNAYDIPGLRIDERYKKSDSNPATLKYASSAAHVTGKSLTSCESMTWLTEHFRTSLSQIKPEMDQLFLNGINRVYYHGSPYTPKDAPWPGWLFYASILVNPNNTIFRDMGGLNDYCARVQSFLQSGNPDNEILVYLPIYDIWQNYRKSNYVAFEIQDMSERLPDFEKVIFELRDLGYDMDYISDLQLQNAKVNGQFITTGGGKYKLVIIPDCKVMSEKTMQHLVQMAKDGATIAFLKNMPENVPGLYKVDTRQDALRACISQIGSPSRISGYSGASLEKGWVIYGSCLQDILPNVPNKCKLEEITPKYGAGFVRRRDENGYIYFMAMNKNRIIDEWVNLGVQACSAVIYDPLNCGKGKALLRQICGRTQIYLQLKPGQSLIIRTFDKVDVNEPLYPVYQDNLYDSSQEAPIVKGPKEKLKSEKPQILYLRGKWSFSFTEGDPKIPGEFIMKGDPVSWTTLKVDGSAVYAGTGRYSLRFKMPRTSADDWMLDFGTISESARICINGEPAGIAWSIPYTLRVGTYLKPGKVNIIDIDVTNLPANRIADYDRRGVRWRIFKEINFVDVFYQNTIYDKWPVMPSGLTQPVKLVPLYLKTKDI